jgi:hypothetical protein
VSRVDAGRWPHDQKVRVSERIGLRRRADDLDLLWRQSRQYAPHRVGSKFQLVECDVGNDNDKPPLPNLFKKTNTLGLEFVVEASPNTDVSA